MDAKRVSALVLLTGALSGCSHLDDLGEPPSVPQADEDDDDDEPRKSETRKDAGVSPSAKGDAGKPSLTWKDASVSPSAKVDAGKPPPSGNDSGLPSLGSARFIVFAGGSVFDTQKWLYWQRDLESESEYCSSVYSWTAQGRSHVVAACTWEEANDFCESARWDGYNTWRLPTESELRSLVDTRFASPDPLIDLSVFPATPPYRFWTSEAENTATTVCFCSGRSYEDELYTYLVPRCVR